MKGGLLEGKALDVAQVKKLATMPSREQMLAELGAGLQAPMAAFVGALSGLFYMFDGALEALRAAARDRTNESQAVVRLNNAQDRLGSSRRKGQWLTRR